MAADTQTNTTPAAATGFAAWLPDRVDRRILVFGWLSFLAELTIIGTGGAVRLTGSGLGCTEWPLCEPDSLVPTGEAGIHGAIEFGNRLMTGVVGILAVLLLVLVWRLRRQRRDLFLLAAIVVGGVFAQAIVGGITVWTRLNPFIVGFHYTASLILVCVSAAFLARAYATPGPRVRAVPGWFAGIVHATSLVLAVTIAVGVFTTASGPHSGDNVENIRRTGVDATVIAHVHSLPGYALVVLALALTIAAWVLRLPPRGWLTAFLVVLTAQVLVGVWQAREGLPEVLVGIHMVLAAVSAAAYVVVVLGLKRPVSSAR